MGYKPYPEEAVDDSIIQWYFDSPYIVITEAGPGDAVSAPFHRAPWIGDMQILQNFCVRVQEYAYVAVGAPWPEALCFKFSSHGDVIPWPGAIVYQEIQDISKPAVVDGRPEWGQNPQGPLYNLTLTAFGCGTTTKAIGGGFALELQPGGGYLSPMGGKFDVNWHGGGGSPETKIYVITVKTLTCEGWGYTNPPRKASFLIPQLTALGLIGFFALGNAGIQFRKT
jgi:hypothetical protein